MRGQKSDLALAYLQSQPASAAAVLEQQPAEYVAAFLRDVPYTHAAAVLKKMLPHYIAAICDQIEPAISASFLSHMDISLVAAIMRHSDKGLSKEVLDLLPDRTKIACRLLLQYNEEVVGAWMVANAMTLPDDCSVKEACTRISSSHDIVDTDAVHVVDRQRQLQGSVSVAKLLRAASDTPISSVMTQNPDAISGRTALISAINHPVWVKSDTVAVINRNRQMVGLLRHVDLRKGLDEISNTIIKPRGSDPLTGMCEVYGKSLLALFNTVGEAAATKRP